MILPNGRIIRSVYSLVGLAAVEQLAACNGKGYFSFMTDKQAVLDALQRLPENASLEEIAEELRIMAAVRRGRADIAAGRSKAHREVEDLLESWATAWTSK